MLTIHLMEAHEFNPIESVSYKAELADSLSNDTLMGLTLGGGVAYHNIRHKRI